MLMRFKSLTATIPVLAALGAAVVGAAPLPALAADPAVHGALDGTILISAKGAAVGVGYTWGDGVLNYHGHEYHFTVKGVSVADVGFSEIVGHGRVYNLHRLSDFSGTYGAATGEATLGNGVGGQYLRNGKGVEIHIDDVTKGARLSGSADGIQLTLRQP
jgi:hypothetical protein